MKALNKPMTEKAAKAFMAELSAKYPHRQYAIRSALDGWGRVKVVCLNPGKVN